VTAYDHAAKLTTIIKIIIITIIIIIIIKTIPEKLILSIRKLVHLSTSKLQLGYLKIYRDSLRF
jgi:hypothetical protein